MITRDRIKTSIPGFLLLLGAIWLWSYAMGNPLHELALIRHAHVATGTLVATYEHEEEDHRGHVYLSEVGVYSFTVPNGDEFKTTTRVPVGELKQREEVEYLADDPAVNRVRGDGCQTVFELLWRKFGFGMLLLILLLSPGIAVIRSAWGTETDR